MEPEPRDAARATGAESNPSEGEPPDQPPEDEASDPVVDDGSVPEKQIQRWKDEGGAVQPPE